MLLRLLPIALLAFTLFAAVPDASASCVGLDSGGSCTGVYSSCDSQECAFKTATVCVGIYASNGCTGVQKPPL